MNSQNAKDYLPLVQALSEGKTIQAHRDTGGLRLEWVDDLTPTWELSPQYYRVKREPEPIVDDIQTWRGVSMET